MIENKISGLTLVDASMDVLLDARATLESEILSRAAEELMRIEKRKQMLEQMLGSSDRVLDAPEIKTRKSRKSVNPPKFYNSQNPEQTWTGRGKPPKWTVEGYAVSLENSNAPFFKPHEDAEPEDCGSNDDLSVDG